MAQARIADHAGELRLPMTYKEWLAWAGGSTQAEWVNGEGIAFVPPTILHADISHFLLLLLAPYVEAKGLGRVYHAPVEMRLTRSAREPDLLFVAQEHLHRFEAARLLGPADLVVEIVSPESTRRDRVEKLAEYEEAGVPEYWLLDPRPCRRTSDFFQLVEGRYRAVPVEPDGRYLSAVLPGFWFRPEWLWREPLPPTRACLAEIAPELF